MNEPALAIDFGTSRTKVAWRDADGAVHLLNFDGIPYLPSLFYLPSSSEDILIGQDANNALEDDPLSVVSELKRAIQSNATIRVTKDRQVDPQALLVQLFQTIKQRVLAEIADFGGVSPEQVWLTVPGNASETMETLLKRAARTVGWDMAQVVHEPVAAARHWLFGDGFSEAAEAMVVVLDCGGGTTDWACLQRTGKKIHRAEHFVPSAVSVGGADVDQALSDWVRERLREQHPELDAVEREPNLRKRLRNWKEATFNGENPTPIRIKGQLLGLDETVLGQEYKRVLLDKVLPPFETFLKPIAEQYPDVQVLLVGGSSTALLEKAVSEMHPHVRRGQDPVGAVIRGALVTASGRTNKQERAKVESVQSQQVDVDLLQPTRDAHNLQAAREAAELQAREQAEREERRQIERFALNQHCLGISAETEKNYHEAIQYYCKAAEYGHVNSLKALGRMYEHGEGVYKDVDEALRWYLKATEKNELSAYASYRMGRIYMNEKENYSQAIYWLNKAIAQGYEGAAEQLERAKRRLEKLGRA